LRFAESDEFGLGEEWVGRLGRISRRIWHVCGACERRLSGSLREFCHGIVEISAFIHLVLSPYRLGYV
jgi:hypothetical protein